MLATDSQPNAAHSTDNSRLTACYQYRSLSDSLVLRLLHLTLLHTALFHLRSLRLKRVPNSNLRSSFSVPLACSAAMSITDKRVEAEAHELPASPLPLPASSTQTTHSFLEAAQDYKECLTTSTEHEPEPDWLHLPYTSGSRSFDGAEQLFDVSRTSPHNSTAPHPPVLVATLIVVCLSTVSRVFVLVSVSEIFIPHTIPK